MAYSYSTSPRGYPVVQGIELISTGELPDRIRTIFPFQLFNAVQSKCFHTIYRTDDNFVLSAPTASGKTAILELAICRLVSHSSEQGYKIVYQAPTKALCAERYRDWQSKFNNLGLTCAELTGDTEHTSLRQVQNASVIITTPEKWDSVTRKWKDHRKLMELIRLFLIDEVHILKEDRGASLEAVVSRMQSVSSVSGVRYVALSATVPNSDDIATWLGRNSLDRKTPAARAVFGEEFRPVELQKHVVGLQSNGSNDFAFEQVCNNKLPDVISKYSEQKPIMIFCFTRKSTETTAQMLSKWWDGARPNARNWPPPKRQILVADEKLRNCISKGVAFHHAGIDPKDRNHVEKAFLEGQVSVICCTSTLAVGVNLPCHLVIIKNTVAYQAEGCKEYSDLEIMQMLGRAGRPQFDDTAVAVIMTKQEKIGRYERMVSGQETLESRLHLNLIDHLNAEIGLKTICDLSSARAWLESTFLYVRFAKNPDHYKLHSDANSASLQETIEQMCENDLQLLHDHDLINYDPSGLSSTEYGDTMARYCVQFETMKLVMGLQPKARISEMISAIAQASEFKSIRFRSAEKQMYKELNLSPSVKFQIPVDIALTAHKVSLIIQSALGAVDLRHDERFKSQAQQFQADSSLVFQNVHRLVRCIIDCQLHLGDSIAVRNGLCLARSLGARAWDDSPLQMIQFDKIGPVAVRKLVNAGVRSIDDLESLDSTRIDMILSKHPPFGANLLTQLKQFPKLRVSLKKMGEPKTRSSKGGQGFQVDVKAEVGFLNDQVPTHFVKKAVHVCVLAETSDGRKAYFCRLSAQRIGNGQDIMFTADVTNSSQLINCYVSCDDIGKLIQVQTLQARAEHLQAGSMREASLNLRIPTSAFLTPAAETNKISPHQGRTVYGHRSFSNRSHKQEPITDDGIDDTDLAAAIDDKFVDIDAIEESSPSTNPRSNLAGFGKQRKPGNSRPEGKGSTWNPKRLSNGNWSCNHQCKDKRNCKHRCCQEGVEKPPKPPKMPNSANNAQVDRMKGFAGQLTKPASEKGPLIGKRKRGSSFSDDETDGLFDGVEVMLDSERPRVIKTTGPTMAKGQSMFYSDSSSPVKSTEESRWGVHMQQNTDQGHHNAGIQRFTNRPLNEQYLGDSTVINVKGEHVHAFAEHHSSKELQVLATQPVTVSQLEQSCMSQPFTQNKLSPKSKRDDQILKDGVERFTGFQPRGATFQNHPPEESVSTLNCLDHGQTRPNSTDHVVTTDFDTVSQPREQKGQGRVSSPELADQDLDDNANTSPTDVIEDWIMEQFGGVVDFV